METTKFDRKTMQEVRARWAATMAGRITVVGSGEVRQASRRSFTPDARFKTSERLVTPTVDEFVKTLAEMQRVMTPPPTQEQLDAATAAQQRVLDVENAERREQWRRIDEAAALEAEARRPQHEEEGRGWFLRRRS